MTHDLVNNDFFVKDLIDLGYERIAFVPGRGLCGIRRMAFTVGIFYDFDRLGHKGRYCFHTMGEAIESYNNWTGHTDPPGNWIKHFGVRSEYSNPNYEEQTNYSS